MSIDELHTKACQRGLSYYIDPMSGYAVMTAIELKRRGECCGSGCRHCPYDHEAVPPEKRARLQAKRSLG